MLFFLILLLPFQALSGFVLITSLYNETHPQRLKEFEICLKKNLNHPLIDSIHVLYDTTKDDNQNTLFQLMQSEKKITLTYLEGRPTFHQIFDLSNELYPNQKVIVSNADIFFDETLKLLQGYDLTAKFLSLTRWDVIGLNQLKPAFSLNKDSLQYGADTWIYKTPIVNFDNLRIGLGTWGCDGGIIYQAIKSPLTVLNPCIDIRCCHMHQSQIRHYTMIDATYPMAWIFAAKLKDTSPIIKILQE